MQPQPFGFPRLFLALATLVLFAAFLSSCGEDRPPTLEERAQSIDKRLICPYCPAETIDQAQVPQASEMRAFVREKLAEGWTDQQILDYFSAPERYGTRVLAEPPKSGSTLIIWLLPPRRFPPGGNPPVLRRPLHEATRSISVGDPSHRRQRNRRIPGASRRRNSRPHRLSPTRPSFRRKPESIFSPPPRWGNVRMGVLFTPMRA